MSEPHAIQRAVLRAFQALGYEYVHRGMRVKASVPPIDRHRFQGRRDLRLVFDPDLWIGDRDVELVVPGCAFLDALEQCLRHRGATNSVVVGGSLALDQGLVEAWTSDFQVALGRFQRFDAEYQRTSYLRLVYEVRVPGPPPRTELIPLVWSDAEDRVLTPQEAAKLMRQRWYSEDEVAGLVQGAVDAPSEARQRAAQHAVEQVLEARLRGVVAEAQARHSKAVQVERKELEADFNQRIAEATSSREAQEMEEEFERRMSRLDEQQGAGIRATLSTVTLMVELRSSVVIHYQHARTGAAVSLRPRVRGGKLLDAQCHWCDRPGRSYLLAPALGHPLVCADCGVACKDDKCSHVLRRTKASACSLCSQPTWCSEHIEACAHCDRPACPDHFVEASCCGRQVCTDHVGASAVDGSSLCADHGRPCSVDRQWYPNRFMIQCPLTGKWLARHHAVQPPGDDRLLHPDAVLVCASSRVLVARDIAKPCGYDKAMHAPSELVRCEKTGGLFCPQHRVRTTWPPPMVIAANRAVTCAESGRVFDVDDAVCCTLTGGIVHRELTVRCPVTSKTLLERLAEQVPGDPRKLHPDAVVECAETGRRLAMDRAVQDTLHPGRWLAREAAVRCEVTGAVSGRSLAGVLQCCARTFLLDKSVADHHKHFLPLSGDNRWVCTDHFGWCHVGEHAVPKSEIQTSAATGKGLCDQHSVRCSCHGEANEPDRVWYGSYAPAAFCGKTPFSDCVRCGQVERLNGDGLCDWCRKPIPLNLVNGAERERYRQHVRPRLPWYTIVTDVRISGTSRLLVVEVKTITGQNYKFRLWRDGRTDLSYNGQSFQEV